MEFIHQQVSISCQVLVSPSLSREAYTRATITVSFWRIQITASFPQRERSCLSNVCLIISDDKILELEKEVSPFTILEFIRQHVSITCQASVSPCKPTELFTRAIILLNSKENLEKLSNFLESPNHIIISSTGRPWLMTEKRKFLGRLRTSIQTFIIFSQTPLERRTVGSNELKVVLSGSREYMEAKERQKMVKEFTEHQCGLHWRLGLEEGKISLKYR